MCSPNKWIAGNPNINLLPLDPLEVPHILIQQGEESPVNVVLKFQNSKVYGVSDMEIYKIVWVLNYNSNTLNNYLWIIVQCDLSLLSIAIHFDSPHSIMIWSRCAISLVSFEIITWIVFTHKNEKKDSKIFESRCHFFSKSTLDYAEKIIGFFVGGGIPGRGRMG